MTKKQLERALELASEWIYARAQTYSYSCPHCPCSHDNDRCRVCFGPCVVEISKEFRNRVLKEELMRKANMDIK
jgi:hypothetical protein